MNRAILFLVLILPMCAAEPKLQVINVTLGKDGEPVGDNGKKLPLFGIGNKILLPDWYDFPRVDVPKGENTAKYFEKLWKEGDKRVWKYAYAKEVLDKYPQ